MIRYDYLLDKANDGQITEAELSELGELMGKRESKLRSSKKSKQEDARMISMGAAVLLISALTGCSTQYMSYEPETKKLVAVNNNFLNKKRAERVTFEEGKMTVTSTGMDNTSVANTVAGTYGLVSSLQETTAQRVSDNALKASQAAEATKRQAIAANPTLVPEGVTPVFSPAVR